MANPKVPDPSRQLSRKAINMPPLTAVGATNTITGKEERQQSCGQADVSVEWSAATTRGALRPLLAMASPGCLSLCNSGSAHGPGSGCMG